MFCSDLISHVCQITVQQSGDKTLIIEIEMSLWSSLQQEGEQMWGLGGCFKFNYKVLMWLPHLKSTVRSLTAHSDERFMSKAGLSGSRGGRAARTWQ